MKAANFRCACCGDIRNIFGGRVKVGDAVRDCASADVCSACWSRSKTDTAFRDGMRSRAAAAVLVAMVCDAAKRLNVPPELLMVNLSGSMDDLTVADRRFGLAPGSIEAALDAVYVDGGGR